MKTLRRYLSISRLNLPIKQIKKTLFFSLPNQLGVTINYGNLPI